MSSYVEIVDDHGHTQRVPVPQAGSGFDGDDRQQVNQLVRSEAGRTAAAVAAGNILTSFLGDGATSQRSAENAAEAINELGQQLQQTEYAPAPVGQPVQQTESGIVVVQQPEQAPTDYELPAEYATYFADDEAPEDEPDDPEPLPAAEQVELDEDDMADPRIAALHAQAERERKRADNEHKLRVKSSRPAWEAEALRVFRLGETPLLTESDIKGIRAESKRDFIRQARAKADDRKAWLAEAGISASPPAPAPPTMEQRQQAWGPPPSSTPPASSETNDMESRLARARGTGQLRNSIKEMIRGNQ